MENVQNFLAMLLDKLKVKSPITFILVQGLLWSLFVAFSMDKLNINESIDTFCIVLIGGIIGLTGPKTSMRAAAYKETKQPDSKDIELPPVDQSNN